MKKLEFVDEWLEIVKLKKKTSVEYFIGYKRGSGFYVKIELFYANKTKGCTVETRYIEQLQYKDMCVIAVNLFHEIFMGLSKSMSYPTAAGIAHKLITNNLI